MTKDINTYYNNILFENIRIDTPVGRVIGILFQNVTKGINHIFNGMIVRNITSKTKLEYTTDSVSNHTQPLQFIEIESCDGFCEINNISFENVIIDGNKILNSSDNLWNLKETGQIISNITYT